MDQTSIDIPNTSPLPRRSKRPRVAPSVIYTPDVNFLTSKYFVAEEIVEDFEMTKMYGSDTYIPPDELSSDEEEEEKLVAQLQKEGHDVDAYEPDSTPDSVSTESWNSSDENDFEPESETDDSDDDVTETESETEVEDEDEDDLLLFDEPKPDVDNNE